MATPYSVKVLEEVASTQDVARRAADEGVPAVVIAHHQTAGRGRSGAGWETAPRAVAVSIAVSPVADAPISLVAGVAARRVLGHGVALKWPNDVVVGDDKLGGILVEIGEGLAVAGLGVNLYWPTAPTGVAACLDYDPGPGYGPDLALAWAGELLGLLEEEPWPRAEYVEACATLGRDVVWEPRGRGRAIDVAADGALVVVTEAGERRISSGEVRHVRPAPRSPGTRGR